MTEPIADWNAALRSESGSALASILRRYPNTDAMARTLAPDGPGPGVRFHHYEDSLVGPKKRVSYQSAFASLEAFLARLVEGDPGGIELGIELVARLEPEAIVPIAERLLPQRPWRGLGMALGRALGACASQRSFELLLLHPSVPYLRDGMGNNGYPGGASPGWSAYRSYGDVARADLPPGDRAEVLPLLTYLLRWDGEPAFTELVRLGMTASHEVSVYAAHRLMAMGTEASEAVLLSRLSATPPGERLSFVASMGIRSLLRREPAQTIDVLGGLELLLTPGGRPRLQALVEELRRDTFPPGGATTQGWLRADPRFGVLCAMLRTAPDRELAKTAGYLLAALPPALAKAAKAKAPATPKKPKPVPREPSAELIAEMEAHRAALQALVAHLKSSGYQFANPKGALKKPTAAGKRAIASLEKVLGPLPPVLKAVWTVIGSLDLRGQDPTWPRPACLASPGVREGPDGVWHTDPLLVLAPETILEEALDEHLEGTPLALPFAPDAVGKAGYSGGALSIYLPTDADDPNIEGGPETESLRAHLERSITWAGMPGFATIEGRPETWLAAARATMR